jgi:hypothetical protein
MEFGPTRFGNHNHLRTIPAKFVSNWLSTITEVDFLTIYLLKIPLISAIFKNVQKCKADGKTRNMY